MGIVFGLFILALLLASAEVFIPGGILGVFAVVMLAVGAYYAYEIWGAGGAVLFFTGGFLVIVAVVFLELKLIAKSGLRHKFVLSSAVSGRTESLRAEDDIIGTDGVTLTKMAPSGMIQIGDRKYEAFSQSGLLEKDQPVRVVGRDNFRLTIEKL